MHVLTPTATVRRIINMTALMVVEAAQGVLIALGRRGGVLVAGP